MSSFSQWPDAVLSPQYWGWLLQGWLMTIWATLLVVVCSSVLGIFLAVARSSAQLWLQWLSRLYLSLFRNTPLLVQLFFWYFGLPALLPESVVAWLNTEHVLGLGFAQLAWPSFEFIAAIIGMVFYSTAYVGEEIRAGFNGVSHTQIHAGLALGMKRGQVLRYIVLPQALAIIKPALFGQYMNIAKNTSLGMAVGLMDLSYRSRQAEAETFMSFQVYGIGTVLYILLVLAIGMAGRKLGRRKVWQGA